MTFWWVNHKQTSKEEIEGGYIWSPTKNNDGSRNQTYFNLTVAKVGDIVFSYAVGEIVAAGVVEREHIESDRPEAFGKGGEQWNRNGWLVQIWWTVFKNPFKPKEYLPTIVPLLPVKYSPIQINGNGNQKCYLATISDDLGKLLLSISQSHDACVGELVADAQQSILDDVAESQAKRQAIPSTEREQLIKARRGQGTFRINVERIEEACRLTGLGDKRLLVASHIKPWRLCDNFEKLDGNNGLLLSPHVDRLFDRGWISFSDKGGILFSSAGTAQVMKAWGLNPANKVGPFNPRQQLYLGFHRSKIYRG